MKRIPLLLAILCKPVIKSSFSSLHSPPSPQFWGNMNDQSPPELGDLGGQKMLSDVKFGSSMQVRFLLRLGLWAGTILLPPTIAIAPTQAAGRSPATCPTAFEPMIAQLLKDLPHYANRLTVKSRKLGGPPPGNYVMTISPPDFGTLPLVKQDSDANPSQPPHHQVFFTSLERQYSTNRITPLQGFHWSIWAQSGTGWQLVTLRSQLGSGPNGPVPDRILVPPKEADYSPIAEGIRLWLRDCAPPPP
jgi:hypothetical protein